jgi:hypothetical protein
MGLAAWDLLLQLARSTEFWDQALVSMILSFIPVYLLIGLKLAWSRKYIRWNGEEIEVGYRLGRYRLFYRRIAKKDILRIELNNQRPSGNLAPIQHRDAQYYIKGHWRVVVVTKKRSYVLDRHTDREALLPLMSVIQTG